MTSTAMANQMSRPETGKGRAKERVLEPGFRSLVPQGHLNFEPVQDLKSASVQQLLFMEPLPFPCHPERSRGICGAPEPQTKAPTSDIRGSTQPGFVPHPPDCSLETTSFPTALLLAPTPGVANCGQPRSQATKVLGKTCELTRGGFCLGFRRTADPSAALGMTRKGQRVP